MRLSKVSIISLALFICPLAAEEKNPIDLEARRGSIITLESHIKEREARLQELTEDLIRLDQRVEKQISRVVEKLASIKDSETSRRGVSQMKMKLMEGLAKSAESYQAKRSALAREIKATKVEGEREALGSDATVMEKMSEKRIDQIIELSKSFTQEKDVEKYERVEGEDNYYYNGLFWENDNTQISEAWRQNRRDKSMDKKQRDAVTAALKKSIQRYETLVNGTQNKLNNKSLSAEDRALIESELKRQTNLLDARKGQYGEMISVDQPTTKAVDKEAVHDMQEAFHDAAADMRKDMNAIRSKYTELKSERTKILKLKANLKARKQWIVDYELKQIQEGK